MSQLKALIEAVKEPSLTKTQLEDFHSQLTNLFALAHLELADREKEEALFFEASEEKTDIATKRKWNITVSGLRLIELKHITKALEKLLSSIKNRMYSTY